MHAIVVATGLALLAMAVPADAQTPSSKLDLPEAALLEIGIRVFQPASDGPARATSYEALRQAEARYIPYLLRSVLEQSHQWGPVRLLPERSPTAELLIEGQVLSSAGDHLELRVRAMDSTGRLWLDRRYSAELRPQDYETAAPHDPLVPLYQQIAADLASVREQLGNNALERIIEVARLRYAAGLSDAFADYLSTDEQGRVQIRRLPAADDPLLARVEHIRQAEYLFVDTVDQHYAQYYRDVGPTYIGWRKAALEAELLMDAYRSRNANSRSGQDYDALRRRYNQFRELKLYEQTLRETVGAFAFEAGPTTLELQGQMVDLTGSLEAQYRQWQELLRRIHANETGLPNKH